MIRTSHVVSHHRRPDPLAHRSRLITSGERRDACHGTNGRPAQFDANCFDIASVGQPREPTEPRQQQTDQYADDGNYYKQLDQRKARRLALVSCGISLFLADENNSTLGKCRSRPKELQTMGSRTKRRVLSFNPWPQARQPKQFVSATTLVK